MQRRFFFALPLLLLATCGLNAQVTWDRLLNAGQEPQNWLNYSGGLSSLRHSALKQIDPNNAKNIEQKWVFQADSSLQNFEATPLVVDGIMYFTQPINDVVALDARTGRVFWMFRHNLRADIKPCCGSVNRGLAILGDTLFYGTLDGQLIALDAENGKPVWITNVAPNYATGYSLTMAPLVIKDKVLIGVAGGEVGIRGFIGAFEAGHWQRSVAVQHGARTGRARPRNLEGRRLAARRRSCIGDRLLRSGTKFDLLGRGKSGAGLEPGSAQWRQPVFVLGGGVGRRYRKAEMVVPIHSQRRVRLRCRADSGARQYELERQPAEVDAVGQP